MSTSEFTVTGMSCGHCEASVRKQVSGVPGVQGVDVDAGTGTLIVTSDGPVADGQILDAVAEAGYSAARVA
ncbi:heavy-metal-associated domain-containing protein [Mycolicibacterium sp. P9-22]|uniref:heavy-metal-associated domain-containing protein n=1 Tax=Mycolicibacterium sp. P9-22 TaxID=2024613 RepID=UPI0011EDE7BE|nr:heavy-metal-associated domain-containing protein [Mycolicibacterium sp. P9-22]KAA0112631.1 copper chaperone [Mycolicibacterium sp. P9-22]